MVGGVYVAVSLLCFFFLFFLASAEAAAGPLVTALRAAVEDLWEVSFTEGVDDMGVQVGDGWGVVSLGRELMRVGGRLGGRRSGHRLVAWGMDLSGC